MISKRTLLGSLPGGHEVYRIDRVAVLTLSSNESPEFELDVSWYISPACGVVNVFFYFP